MDLPGLNYTGAAVYLNDFGEETAILGTDTGFLQICRLEKGEVEKTVEFKDR